MWSRSAPDRNRYLLRVALVVFNKLQGLHKHTAGTAARVVNDAFVRLDDRGNQVNDILRRIEFAFSFSFRDSEPLQEIFINPADDVGLFVRDGVNPADLVNETESFDLFSPSREK